MAKFIESKVAAVVPHMPMVTANEDLSLATIMRPAGFIERVGRTCYKSEDRIGDGTADKFVRMLKRRGHHAMLEHCVVSSYWICNRGVTHELVRHRLAAYAQESTRYCDYSAEGKHEGVTFIIPPELSMGESSFLHSDRAIWEMAMSEAERHYQILRERGVSPQIARGVLPIDVKTEIWITANLREWMHIFKMRCASDAHPHIRRLAQEVERQLAEQIPSVFEAGD